MELNDILNRFEILFSNDSRFSDLRRSVVDRDLYSIFRLLKIEPQVDIEDVDAIEDLRKAVIDQNLYSIFRLAKNEDLRKLVLDGNVWSLWRILDRFTDSQFVPSLKNLIGNNIDFDTDCLSQGQIKSKLWLIDELKKLDIDLGTVFLCAGWYATLATMMFENNIQLTKIRSFDNDSECINLADIFNKHWVKDNWKFKAVTKDILDIDYQRETYKIQKLDEPDAVLTDIPDTIINTSCEHIINFADWWAKIPQGKLVIVQSNNYFSHYDSGHVNCVVSLEEFAEHTPMQLCLYEGELGLPKYTRYMRIGYR